MPNLTLHFSADQLPASERLAQLTEHCARLCCEVLQALPEQVHIAYASVIPGCGHPVFAHLQYRLKAQRTPAVMAAFMQGLDDTISRHTGLTARIRCFGYGEEHLHARN